MGDKTVYQLLLDAADELGVQHEWTSVFSAYNEGDTSDVKLRRSLTKACQYLAKSLDWEIITAEQTFTTVAGEEQTSWRPADFLRFVPDTLWNRSGNLPIVGPLSPGQWQQYKAGYIIPTYPAYFVRSKRLYLASPPGAGQTIAFEYITNAIGENAAGDRISTFTADTDVPLWDDELLTLGVIANYRQIERMEYASDKLAFELCLTNNYKADGGVTVFNMNQGTANPADTLVDGMKNRVVAVQTS